MVVINNQLSGESSLIESVGRNMTLFLKWTVYVILLGLVLCCLGCEESVSQNAPPEIIPIPDRYVEVGRLLDFTITAQDPEGGVVIFGIEESPERSRFFTTSGIARFQWTPIASDATSEGRTHQVIFWAEDSDGARSTARISIIVTFGDNSPRFVSPASYILNLERQSEIDIVISVKDDDSSSVQLSMTNHLEGTSFKQNGDKEALLSWTPTEAQIEAQTVYLVGISANDGSSPEVTQELHIILRRKDSVASQTCEESRPPEIEHEEVGDQRGIDDYLISADITDGESHIVQAVLFWTDGNPVELDNYLLVEMELASDQSEYYFGSVPNPGLGSGESRQIFYFICSFDDDDPGGEECDAFACKPEEGYYSFTAYSPGDVLSCADDSDEPNNFAAQAVSIESGRSGMRYLCPDDWDLFVFELTEPSQVAARILFTENNGLLNFKLLAPDGEVELAAGESAEFGAVINTFLGNRGFYFLEVAGVPNSYEVELAISSTFVCEPDSFEPNNTFAEAVEIFPGRIEGLRICPDDIDLYGVFVGPGALLSVSAEFSQSLGDLDLYLIDSESDRIIQRADTTTDNESFLFEEFEQEGLYLIYVVGYEGAANNYSLEIEVEERNIDCVDDMLEPNNTFDQASSLSDGRIEELMLCAETVDFFSFYGTPGQEMTAEISFYHEHGDLDLILIAPDRVTQLQESLSESDNEEVTIIISEEGVYYLYVTGYEDGANSYSLNLFLSGLPSCEEDPFEPNESPGEAASIPAEGISGLTLCEGDRDWYIFSFENGEYVLFEVDFAPVDTQLQLELYDSDGVTWLESAVEDIEGTLSILWGFSASGIYYFSVEGGDGIADYSIRIITD